MGKKRFWYSKCGFHFGFCSKTTPCKLDRYPGENNCGYFSYKHPATGERYRTFESHMINGRNRRRWLKKCG